MRGLLLGSALAAVAVATATSHRGHVFLTSPAGVSAAAEPSAVTPTSGAGFQLAGPPEPIVSDYVELTTLMLLFIVGAPLNLAAYTQIGERPAYTRLDILKRHLNYSDLLVLFVYVPSRACWLITYDWRGGDFLCKFIKFMHTFTFQVSSNVIVCIAMDRLLTVISSSHHNPERAHHRMRLFLAIAWITALIISAPQFAIWRDYLAFEHLRWSQCMQIWEILRAESYLHNTSANSAQVLEMVREENIYMVIHMLLIFWIPALIIMLCYVIVSCWVYFNSRPSFLAAAECAAAEAAQAASATSHRARAHTVSYQPLPATTFGGGANGVAASAGRPNAHRTASGNKCAAGATTAVVANGIHYQTTLTDAAGGVHFAKNPKIVIDDIDVTMPLTQNNNDHSGEGGSNYANNICQPAGVYRIGVTAKRGSPALQTANEDATSPTMKMAEVEATGRQGSKGSMMSAVRNSQSSSYSARQNRSRAIRVSFSLVAAYIICWFPYNALSVIQFIDPVLFNRHAKKVYCLHGMIVFNSVINPYLYGLFGRLCRPKTAS